MYTRLIRSACDRALGNASPAVRPSALTPVATITACTRSPSAKAADSGFMSSTPAPSARTYPSAAAENGRHRPVGDSIEAWEKPAKGQGLSRTFTAPANARALRPDRSTSHA